MNRKKNCCCPRPPVHVILWSSVTNCHGLSCVCPWLFMKMLNVPHEHVHHRHPTPTPLKKTNKQTNKQTKKTHVTSFLCYSMVIFDPLLTVFSHVSAGVLCYTMIIHMDNVSPPPPPPIFSCSSCVMFCFPFFDICMSYNR